MRAPGRSEEGRQGAVEGEEEGEAVEVVGGHGDEWGLGDLLLKAEF